MNMRASNGKILSLLLFFIITFFPLTQSPVIVRAEGQGDEKPGIVCNLSLKYEQGDITKMDIAIKNINKKMKVNISISLMGLEILRVMPEAGSLIEGNSLILPNMDLGSFDVTIEVNPNAITGSINITINTVSGEKIFDRSFSIPLRDPLDLNYSHRYLGSNEWEINATINATAGIKVENITLNAMKCHFINEVSESCIKTLNKNLSKGEYESIKVNVTLRESDELPISVYSDMGVSIISERKLSLKPLMIEWEEKGKGINRSISIRIKNKQSDIDLSKVPIYVNSSPPGALKFRDVVFINGGEGMSYFIGDDYVRLSGAIKHGESIELNISYSLYKNATLAVKYIDRDLGEKRLNISSYRVNVEHLFPYYVVARADVTVEIPGAIKVGDGYLLVRQVFWPILTNDTIKINCEMGGESYLCSGEISVPLCGIGTIALVALVLPISLWATARRRAARDLMVIPERVEIPEHLDLG